MAAAEKSLGIVTLRHQDNIDLASWGQGSEVHAGTRRGSHRAESTDMRLAYCAWLLEQTER
jgi:hypothetical protein